MMVARDRRERATSQYVLRKKPLSLLQCADQPSTSRTRPQCAKQWRSMARTWRRKRCYNNAHSSIKESRPYVGTHTTQ